MQTLGVKLLEVAEGTVTLELPISSAVAQQNGFVHAGAIASLLDSACGFAALSVMPQEKRCVGGRVQNQFRRPRCRRGRAGGG